MLRKAATDKYNNRVEQKTNYEMSRPKTAYIFNEFNEIFEGDTLTKANEVLEKEITQQEQQEQAKGKAKQKQKAK